MDKGEAHYSATLRAAHWLTVLAIIAAYALIELRGIYPKGSDPRILMVQGHYLAGLAVLALLIPRILARVARPAPLVIPAPGLVAVWLARILHIALYAFLVVQPILGVLQVNLAGKLVTLPWIDWSLPVLVGPNHAAQEQIAELHETLGNIFYWVIGAHIAAALWHHLIVRDNVLRRML